MATDDRGTRVALKILIEHGLDNSDAVERFRREMRACQLINSKDVARPLASQLEETPRWIAFEFVDGEDLRDALYRGLENEAAGRILVEIAQAIWDLDHHGVVHRDLKPENIRIGSADSVTVIDLGLAKYSEWSTITRGPAGTWKYIAPEVAAIPDQATSACDVWALGMMVAEVTGGRHPLRDYSDYQIFGLLSEGADLPKPKIPVEWLGVARACLRQDPHFRPRPSRLTPAAAAAAIFGSEDASSHVRQARRQLRSTVARIECAPGGRTSWEILRSLLGAVDVRYSSSPDEAHFRSTEDRLIADLAIRQGYAPQVVEYVTEDGYAGLADSDALRLAECAAQLGEREAMQGLLTLLRRHPSRPAGLAPLRFQAELAGEADVEQWIYQFERQLLQRDGTGESPPEASESQRTRWRILQAASRGDVHEAMELLPQLAGNMRWMSMEEVLHAAVRESDAETFCALLLEFGTRPGFRALLKSYFRPRLQLGDGERLHWMGPKEFPGALYPHLGDLAQFRKSEIHDFDPWLRQVCQHRLNIGTEWRTMTWKVPQDTCTLQEGRRRT